MKSLSKYFLPIILILLFHSISYSQPTTWLKTIDIPGGLFKVQQTYDGGFIAVGNAIVFPNPSKIFLVKVNAFGDTLWTRKFGVPDLVYDGFWIENSPDKGNIITGGTPKGIGSNAYMLKTDILGYEIWYHLYNNQNFQKGYCVKSTIDGGYVLLCRNAYPTTSDFLLIKTDGLGNIQWQKNYDSGLTSNHPAEIDLVDDGYILAGSSYIIQQTSFIWLLRLNSNGDTLWTRKYNNNIQSGTVGVGVQTVSKGGFVILGSTNNYEISYIIKTDSSGNAEWERTYSSYNREFPYSIREIPGTGYVFCGTADSVSTLYKGFIRVIDYDGNLIHEKFYQVPGFAYTDFRSVEVTSDGGFILCGNNTNSGQSPRKLLAKTDPEGNIVGVNQISSVVPSGFKLYQNYPNPFNPITIITYELPAVSDIKLSIYDVLGREITVLSNERQSPGKYNSEWNANKFSSGIYFYYLTAKDQQGKIIYSASKRMLLIK